MTSETYSKHKISSVKRLRRFVKKSGSVDKAFRGITEEAFVRLYDHLTFRNIISGFVSPKEPEKWVFLVGCYNSGTTLLQKILGSHPQIAGLPREGVRFTTALSNLELNNHHMIWDESWRDHASPSAMDSDEAVAQIKKDWGIFWKSRANIYFDKSVSNTARIEWLDKNFNNAHFIGLHRNGYCIAEGLHRRSRPPQWLQNETGKDHYPLEMTAEQWAMTNRVMLDGIAKVDRKMILSFEETIEDPVTQVEKVFKFLGVDGGNTRFDKDNATLIVNDKKFPLHNPNPASLARLGENGKATIKPIIEPMMQELGYNE